MHTDTVTLAAGMGGHFLGYMTVVGLAGPVTIMFIAGLRGSDTIKIDNKKKAMVWGILVGQLWVAASGTLGDIANGVDDVSDGVFGGSQLWGSAPGQGGVCFTLFAIAYSFRWPKMVWPALFSLALGIGMGDAGGLWAIAANVFKTILGNIVGRVT
ncbi:hypothetical protein ACFU6S_32625 [Streptomyces sp. NPDC057456]|uniref:hypothetical protein n=1 Tax=Streptomyces sp. NPDC057456 TaxID=3346139 RepID=UPI0036CB5A45